MMQLAAAMVLLVVDGVAAQSSFGTACSLNSCSCAGFCLADQKGKVVDTPPDSEGYAYKFSLCSVLAEADLPSGCRDLSSDATVVKYKVCASPFFVSASGSDLL
jgi:hypothetical protein